MQVLVKKKVFVKGKIKESRTSSMQEASTGSNAEYSINQWAKQALDVAKLLGVSLQNPVRLETEIFGL